ncbi:catechol 1,2-dioxygenase [Caballeronia hypogeia]|uniref:Catechol 1,2-dioxygenase n=1 Tax=Caballeronia hypogeia TaxID=1777140 RepID=A0A158CVV5_9BURK|nr:intradiol ring-cleavage dioxygenase [Caballeronia hypogeia]SAK86458.1 catechol 1,2-dioxygenase [Caballeronia hypogeia]
MRNFNEHNITEAVLARLDASRSSRVKEISGALVRHLHAFVREVRPTQDEWQQAIAFLTRTGQVCSDTRQEFILLSDALGVSMLVDAINHEFPGGATETTVLGPFYVADAPEVSAGATIGKQEDGPTMLIEGRVLDTAGSPISGAIVDIWHADADGYYDVQKSPTAYSGRGRVKTDAQGNFWLWGTLPAAYPIPDDGPVGEMLGLQGRHPYRPAHVHFMIAAEGCETLVTHLFLASSDYLDSDVVFGVKDSLIEPVIEVSPGKTPYGAVVETSVPAMRREFILAPRTRPRE